MTETQITIEGVSSISTWVSSFELSRAFVSVESVSVPGGGEWYWVGEDKRLWSGDQLRRHFIPVAEYERARLNAAIDYLIHELTFGRSSQPFSQDIEQFLKSHLHPIATTGGEVR